MDSISRTLIEQLPKTDLHCHFDGSIRIETLIDLAKKNRVKLPSYEPEILMKHMKYGETRTSLEEYLQGFEPIIAVLQEDDDIERAFFEVCEDAAFENVWHLELRYCPALHTQKGLTAKEMVETSIRAGLRAEEKFGISVRHIICGLKNFSSASIMEMSTLACQFRDEGVVAFDLAGPETGFPIRDHLKAIYYAKKNHLGVTLHAGESSGPDYIAEALNEGGAQRIGHGTSLLNDKLLLRYVIDNRIGIESCPLSNCHTGSVKSLKLHPLKRLLDQGVRVSINTDNRLCSKTSITEEIMAVIKHLEIDLENVHKLLLNGFKSAFLPHETKAMFLRDFDAEWTRLIKL